MAVRRLSFLNSIEIAITEEMRRDPGVFVMGTNPSTTLASEFGEARVRRMPISEALFAGLAVGAAASGLRPIVMFRNVTFAFLALDQIVDQAAKLRYMSGGQVAFPIVFWCHGGPGVRMAAQHSQSPYAIFAQFPGLKVVVPSNAADAMGLMKAAVRDNNPVVLFAATRLDDLEGEIPSDDYVVPIGQAAVHRRGTAATVVAVGATLPRVLAAADELAASGVTVDVIDPRSIVPMDVELLKDSVRRTGRLIIVDDAPAACSVAAEVAAVATEDEKTFRSLRTPIRRLCGAPVPIPYSPVLEDVVVPDIRAIVTAVLDSAQVAHV